MEKLFYEVIPPPTSWSHEKVSLWTEELIQMLQNEGVRAINLPEVVNEAREEERVVPFLEKTDNLEYAIAIKEKWPVLDVIPNKICVRISEQELLDWVGEAEKTGISKMVLVGGDGDEDTYPGPSVTKAAKLIRERFPRMELGGITIFTREREAKRIFEKMQHGITFFISQIIFETSNAKCVLLDLQRLCREAEVKMPRIYLSMAPASSKTDIEFMQWLGVEFPAAVRSYFIDNRVEVITERVFEILNVNLDELEHFLSQNSFDVGIVVEQVMYKSMDNGERLLKLVKQKVGKCL